MGRNYSGNPKHVYEQMIRKSLDKKLKCIWLLEDPNIEIPGNAKKVKKSRLKYYYYLARAKIWVFDTRDPPHILKREQDYYIQT
jgi:CDP-glycerol glycerophosphotransferase